MYECASLVELHVYFCGSGEVECVGPSWGRGAEACMCTWVHVCVSGLTGCQSKNPGERQREKGEESQLGSVACFLTSILS